jgi:hypothetical protein
VAEFLRLGVVLPDEIGEAFQRRAALPRVTVLLDVSLNMCELLAV